MPVAATEQLENRSKTEVTPRFVFAVTYLVGFLAHGFCYFNTLYSHDSIAGVQDDKAWKIALGRFMQAPYMELRGKIMAPLLIGVLSLTFLALSCLLLVRMLGIARKGSAAALIGVLATSVSITAANATYIHESDSFMLALLFCVAGVFFAWRYRWGWLPGAALLCVGMGFYQAYLDCAVALCLILLMLMLLCGDAVRQVLRQGIAYLLLLGLGGVGYFVCDKIALYRTGVEAHSNNKVGDIANFVGISRRALLGRTWLAPFDKLKQAESVHPQLLYFVNVLLLVLVAVRLCVWAWRCRRDFGRVLLMAGLLLVFPFGVNAVYFLAHGEVHTLMTFSYAFGYLLAFAVLEGWQPEWPSRFSWLAGRLPEAVQVAAGLAAVVCFCNVVYSNQAYQKKDQEKQEILSMMTRILDRVEQTDGYIPGTTPVVFVGKFELSPILQRRMSYEHMNGTVGLSYRDPITYLYTAQMYLQGQLAYPINFVTDVADWENDPYVMEMRVFPDKDAVQVVNDCVVVKISYKQ